MRNRLSSSWIKNALAFLGPNVVRYIVIGVVTGVFLFVVELGFAYILQAFLISIGAMSAGSAELPSWFPSSNLRAVILFVLVIGMLRSFLHWAQLFTSQAAYQAIKHRQRSKLLQWAFHSESVNSSQVITYFNEYIEAAGSVMMGLQQFITFIPIAVLLLGSLFFISPISTSIATGVMILFAIALRAFDRKIATTGAKITTDAEQINNRLLRSIKNLLLMQIYGTQAREEALAQRSLEAYTRGLMLFFGLTGVKYVIPQMLGIIMVCVISIVVTKTGSFSPSLLITYFYLFLRFAQTLAQASKVSSDVIFYWPRFMEVKKWWDLRAHELQLSAAERKSSTNATKTFDVPFGWKLNNVTFQYPTATAPTLKVFELTIKPRQATIIVGASGAGKSTLLSILLGILKPGSGEVSILSGSGEIKPLESVRQSLLRSIGYVGAESFLVEGTVRDNLIYGLDQPPSQEDISDALRKAECQFVYEMPRQLDHVITEQGQGLSAGQKQRLALARAILRKPKVLILDEATANLDEETEQRLVHTLTQLKAQMTIVAVTHKQALLQIADQKVQF